MLCTEENSHHVTKTLKQVLYYWYIFYDEANDFVLQRLLVQQTSVSLQFILVSKNYCFVTYVIRILSLLKNLIPYSIQLR